MKELIRGAMHSDSKEGKYYMETKKAQEQKTVEVVAALIRKGDQFMICQRPAHKSNGSLWEFVGGKVENGETLEEALIRECREELDITLKVGDAFTEVYHTYPDIRIHLTLFHATIESGTPKRLEHNDIRWITPEEIPLYPFCPADTEILEKIKRKFSCMDEG